jgi:hypothetical protein
MEIRALKKLDGETAHASSFSLDAPDSGEEQRAWVRLMMLIEGVWCAKIVGGLSIRQEMQG